ncbi:NACHT domain-containing protein [Streptosporangium sp. NPDC023615]|uniref:NACHT domain-containing protein n=1 Tax=Streptosporangium sp. NPDC023615 TaxID=3154794 RepID=UPI0034409BF3
MDLAVLVTVGGAVLLFGAGWLIDKFFGGLIEEIGKRTLDRLLRRPSKGLLGQRALRKYVNDVRRNYATHTMSFRQDDAAITVEEVYIPVQYQSGGRRLDVEQAVVGQSRVVIVGEPGAGKSMLLKHLMLAWARDPMRDPHVPVLIDLHQYGSSTLRELLAKALSHGRRQISLEQLDDALDAGRLRLYFDGLDEVTRDNFPAVLNELRELARGNSGCPMVVTCRESVYRGILAAEFGAPLKVAELDDAALRRLLLLLIKDRKRCELLVAALHANRQVLELARSPMLLTMISYLYEEGLFGERAEKLPKSRSEFYEQAVAYLLRRDEARGLNSMTRHGPAVKLAVLRKVALLLMNKPSGRTISHRELLAEVRAEADDFNLEPREATELIDEIVDRSRLLIRLVDADQVYAFRHLTLQEYLAAVELTKRGDELLKLYRGNPTTWQEVVRIWCGQVSEDCTWLLRAIYTDPEAHPLVLLCLAEATRVDHAFAEKVIDAFIARVRREEPLQESVIRALGTLAGAGGPRGRRVLSALLEIADPDVDAPAHVAYRVLAASGAPEALRRLLEAADSIPTARHALRTMGDLAVHGLAKEWRIWTIDELGLLGTPAAAEALFELLPEFHDPQRVAWWLAALLNSDDVRAAFSGNTSQENSTWITKPYRGDWSPQLCSVVEVVVKTLRGSEISHLVEKQRSKASPGLSSASVPPAGLPSIFPPIALAALAADPNPIVRLSLKLSEPERVALEVVKSRVRVSPGMLESHDSGQVWSALWNISHKNANDKELRTAADKLAELVISKAEIGEAVKNLLCALEWPMRAVIAGGLLKGWGGRQDWALLKEVRPKPVLLRRIFAVSLSLTALLVVGAGCYRLVSTIRGSWPGGATLLVWVTSGGIVLLLVAGVLCVVTSLFDIARLFSIASYIVTLLSGVVGGVGLLMCGLMTLADGQAPLVGGYGIWLLIFTIGICILFGLGYRQRYRLWANPYRRLLVRCAPHCLPSHTTPVQIGLFSH